MNMLHTMPYVDLQAKTPDMARISPKTMKQIDEKAKEFEGVFIQQMLEPLFKDIETDGMFGGGHAEEVYRSFALQEYGRLMAERGGFGIAEKVKAELIAAQANASGQRVE